ncbi:MAG: class I SAM-dependent methyltransferase [Synergistaceae bacterium]|jgi:predicted O-methyltransferase YrrM|nr:class I SAM-dependent methyltransferase [Synergistaceae bacterium]
MRLKNSGIVFEKREQNIVDDIYDKVQKMSEMTYEESCFLNGLVRYLKPKKILEIGVAAGASTCVLLNAVKDNIEIVVHSVDWSREYYRNPSQMSGWRARELFPNESRWNLHLGVDVSEVIEDSIKGGVDFLLLDTAHVHPAETLSFLSVFPYLTEDAVVVLHDVNLFSVQEYSTSYATKLLLDSVVADKITLNDFGEGYLHPNIAAFQINADTRQYINDVVRSLFFPWGMEEPERILRATEDIFRDKYPGELHELYLKSVKQNQNLYSRSVALNQPIVTFGQRALTIKRELRAMCVMCLPSSWVAFLKRVRKTLTGK